MGAFARDSAKLQRQGESKHEADAVMAIAGRKKYGKKGFAAKIAAGRKKRDVEIAGSLSLSDNMGMGAMLQNYSDEDVVAIVSQLVAEAILEGRLDNVADDEVNEATEIGLSLGFVEQTANGGLALARAATAEDFRGAMKEFSRGAMSKKFGGAGKPIKNVKPLFGAGRTAMRNPSQAIQHKLGRGLKATGGILRRAVKTSTRFLAHNPVAAPLIGIGAGIGLKRAFAAKPNHSASANNEQFNK